MLLLLLLGCVAGEPLPPPVDSGGAVIKTWGFLRSTTDSLGEEAQDVLMSKGHLEDMERDIDTQRQAWEAAKTALTQQNEELKAQVAEASKPPPDLETQKQALLTQIQNVQGQVQDSKLQEEKTISVWQVHRKAYQEQILTLEKTQTEVQDAMSEGAAAGTEEQQSLEVTQTELKSKVLELKTAVDAEKQANGTESLAAARNETSIQATHATLLQESEAVKGDLVTVQKTASEAPALHQQLAAGQADLALAQEHKLQTKTSCDSKTEQLSAVLEAEKRKVEMVRAETQRCAAFEAQRDFLRKEVSRLCPAVTAVA